MNCAQVRSAYWKEEKPQRIVASLRPSGLSVCSDLCVKFLSLRFLSGLAALTKRRSIDKPRYEPQNCACFCSCARMAELADALASGANGRKVVEVRVFIQ